MHLDLDPIAKVSSGDFIEKDFEFDDSERDFLRELTDAIPEEDKLDSSKAVGVRNMMDEEDDDLEREEAKEEEYDYFLDAQNDENANAAHGYHIIDENDLQNANDDSDLEELDEEEKQDRHNNMFREFRE